MNTTPTQELRMDPLRVARKVAMRQLREALSFYYDVQGEYNDHGEDIDAMVEQALLVIDELRATYKRT